MKMATYNVNGLRARMPLLTGWLKEELPDVVCLQETKVTDDLFPVAELAAVGYECAFIGEKSFNGVAILSRVKPDEVKYGFAFSDPTDGPRFIRARFGDLWVLNTYIPQGQDVHKEQFQYKLKWLERFQEEVEKTYTAKDHLIWVGDLNVALTDKDVHSPEKMIGNVGFHPDEQAALLKCQNWGFMDLFRQFHPEEVAYTFWDYRVPNGFKRNIGWRLDYIYATSMVAQTAVRCEVATTMRTAEKPSDHAPVIAMFKE